MGALTLEELPHYTYDEYVHWEGRWEIIYGIAYNMSPAPMYEHQRISNNIAWQLNEKLNDCQECKAVLPMDWKIDEDTVVQPDNMVICYTPETPYLTKAPKLIFEIVSKSSYKKDTVTKYGIYGQEGVPVYVLIFPEDKLAKVYHLVEGRYVKLGDYSKESANLDFSECSMDFDFGRIWE